MTYKRKRKTKYLLRAIRAFCEPGGWLRRVLCGALAAALVLSLTAVSAVAADSHGDVEVLVIYDAGPLGRNGRRVSAIYEILTYMAKSYVFLPPQDVADVESYSYIIIVADGETLFPDDLIHSLQETDLPILVIGAGGLGELVRNTIFKEGLFEATYTFDGTQRLRWVGRNRLLLLSQWDNEIGGTLTTEDGYAVPLCAAIGNISAIPWIDETDDAMLVALTNLIAEWMWPYANSPLTYALYLVLRDVYPIEDPERMIKITQMLIEEGVPYTISVMPIYDNAYFASMGWFCDYLRYAQANGASIVMRTPLTPVLMSESGEMIERMELAFDAYTQWDVYPLAIAAPQSWLFSEEGLDILRTSRTVILFEESENIDEMPYLNLSFADGHNIIVEARDPDRAHSAYGYSNAVFLDIYEDVEQLRETVREYKNSQALLRSIGSMGNSMYIGRRYIRSDPFEGIFLDGQSVSTDYVPVDIPEDFDYGRDIVSFLTEEIEDINAVTIMLAFVTGSIFIYSISRARRRVRMEFLIKTKEKQPTEFLIKTKGKQPTEG